MFGHALIVIGPVIRRPVGQPPADACGTAPMSLNYGLRPSMPYRCRRQRPSYTLPYMERRRL
eukprot:11459987-Heterocapsa_arctica.AAC.1